MKTKTRKLSIKLKVMIITNILVLCTICILSYTFIQQLENDMVYMGVEQARIAARMADVQIDGDALTGISVGDEQTEAYQNLLSDLRRIKKDCNLAYLYTLSTDRQNVYYGVDSDESSRKNAIGQTFDSPYNELRMVFEGEEYVQDYIDHTDDGYLITAYVPVFDSNNQIVAILGSDYNAAEIVAKIDDAKKRTLILGGISLIVSLILLNLVIGSIMRSIKAINKKLYELVHNEGDLTQTLTIKTGDEMELMSENVNELLEYIHKIMLNISDNSSTLKTSTETVMEALTSASEDVMDISATMQQMSAAMQESTASLNEIGGSISDMHNNIDDISSKAQEENASSERIAKKAQEIHANANTERKKAHVMAKEMTKAVNEKIEKAKSVEEINLLTENIISLTEQTNLLALNASIEAARAGESGRGFAVVASEIGKLANDSAKTAERIKLVSSDVIASVEELATESEKMIAFMENTAMDGYNQLLAMSDDYSSNTGQIHKVMERFAEDSDSLKQAMDNVRETVLNIGIAVEESTKGIISVTEMSADMSERVKDIESKADINQKIVEQLEAEIGKFKL